MQITPHDFVKALNRIIEKVYTPEGFDDYLYRCDLAIEILREHFPTYLWTLNHNNEIKVEELS